MYVVVSLLFLGHGYLSPLSVSKVSYGTTHGAGIGYGGYNGLYPGYSGGLGGYGGYGK